MARTRLLSPKLFLDDDLADCSIAARYLFAGLPTLADRDGRLEDRPKKIKAELLPFDDLEVDELLNELASPRRISDGGFILRYQVNGRGYIQIRNFWRYQNPHRNEIAGQLPPPPEDGDVRALDGATRSKACITPALNPDALNPDADPDAVDPDALDPNPRPNSNTDCESKERERLEAVIQEERYQQGLPKKSPEEVKKQVDGIIRHQRSEEERKAARLS